MAAALKDAHRISRVCVVGAGLIGAGWVAAYLARGLAVSVYDPSPEAPSRVGAHIASAWPALLSLGLATAAEPGPLAFFTDLADALSGADFVQESTPERRDLKLALYAELGTYVPADVIIASSTSGMPVSLLQSSCPHPERCVLGHPFNPVHLMPLVEIGGGEKTDPAAVDVTEALYVSMRKRPVRVRREITGHIANRLTSAMFREAVSLVAQGNASVKDVDDAIRFGPALKWAIQGQFTTFHTSGGEGGLANFLRHFTPSIMDRWKTMTDPPLADADLQARLAAQLEQAHGGRTVSEITRHQDEALLALLRFLQD